MSEDEDWADDTPLEIFKKSVDARVLRKKANEAIKTWPDEKELKKLDTNIRKNSAFVKAKLETLRENQRKALETEFKKLNLVRYKQEAITTLTTTKYKQVDIELAVFICELFHHRFTDFQDMVCEAWKGIFGKYRELFNNHKRSEKKKPDNKDTIPPDLDLSKIRLDIKFISELTCLSILPGKSGLGLLHYILGQFMVENEGKQKEFLPLVLTILKNIGDSIFGLVAKSKTDEICSSTLIPAEKQTIFSDMLKKYYEWLVSLLKDKHKELQRQEKRNLRMLTEVKGEISDKRKEQTRNLHEDYQFWLEKLNTLADYLSVELPDFDAVEKAEESKIGIEIVIEKVKAAGDLGVWEDEDQKAFYTSIRGLKDTIPGILWQQSSNIHRDPEKARKSRKKKGGRVDTNKPKMGKDLDGDMFGYMDDFYEFDSDDDLDLETGADLDDGSGDTLTFNSWMTKLSECYNRDLVDQAAENFCLNLNTPSNRKKLINTIGTIAKSRMDLIPFNCRLVCTLMPLMPHVGEDIIAIVLSTFRFFLRKRENINVSSKQKVVKYIAELTKFDLIDRSIALGCIRVLLADFRAHSIEMLCTLLTGCGKFLYLQEDSHRQLKLLLEKLDRLKIVKLPDYKYKSVIENALLATVPQDEDDDAREMVKQAPKHPILLFAEHLILHELGNVEKSGESEAENCNRIIKVLRKFPLKRMTKAAEEQFMGGIEVSDGTRRSKKKGSKESESEKSEQNQGDGQVDDQVDDQEDDQEEDEKSEVVEKSQEKSIEDEKSQQSEEEGDEEEGPKMPTISEIRQHVMLLLSSGYKVRFSNLPYLANVVAGLNQHYETIGVEVADAVLEDIRRGMEIAHPQFNQRRVSQVKYLAELYNYRIVNSAVIFKTVYTFLNFGRIPVSISLMRWICDTTHEYRNVFEKYDDETPAPEPPSDSEDEDDEKDGANVQFEREMIKWEQTKFKNIGQTKIGVAYAKVVRSLFEMENQMQKFQSDKPDDLFRIRLVCSLLETCGSFFSKGGARKKLDFFIDHFQYYVSIKRLLPCWRPDLNGKEWPKHYDYLISDTVQPLRPSLHLVKPMELDDMNPLLDRLLSLEKEMTQELRDKSRIPDEQKAKNEKLDQIMEEEPENEKSENNNLNSNSRTSMSKSNEHNLDSMEDENYSEDDDDAESDDYDSEEEERLRQEEEMEMERLIEAQRLEVETQRRKIEDARKAEQDAKIRKEEAEAFDKMFDTVIKQEVTYALEQNWQTSTRNDTLPVKLLKSVVPETEIAIEADPITSKPKIAFSLMTRGRGKDKAPQFSNIKMEGDAQIMMKIEDERAKQQAEADVIKSATMQRHEEQMEEEYNEEQDRLKRLNPKYKPNKKKTRPPPTVRNQDEDATPITFDKYGTYRHQQGVPQNLNDIFGSKF